MKSYCDICYGEEISQRLDIHLPECDTFPVFLYFHGGGIESGDKAGEAVLFEHLTARGVAVVSANYRMYPSAKYPEFLEDAADAAAWVVNNIGNYGTARGIYIGGSSAGGYLSMMLCFNKALLDKRGISPTQIAGYIHDAGQPTAHFNVLRERGIDSRRVIIDESAPLYFVGDDSEYPPMLIIVSDNDMQNRFEQTMLLISTLKHFGHTEPEVSLKVMHGTHCAYVGAVDERGESVFGQLICEYILN